MNPFNEFSHGTRVPSLVNDQTIALRDHQSCQIVAGATGRMAIFMNYNMLGTSPYIAFTNLLNPFTTAAV